MSFEEKSLSLYATCGRRGSYNQFLQEILAIVIAVMLVGLPMSSAQRGTAVDGTPSKSL